MCTIWNISLVTYSHHSDAIVSVLSNKLLLQAIARIYLCSWTTVCLWSFPARQCCIYFGINVPLCNQVCVNEDSFIICTSLLLDKPPQEDSADSMIYQSNILHGQWEGGVTWCRNSSTNEPLSFTRRPAVWRKHRSLRQQVGWSKSGYWLAHVGVCVSVSVRFACVCVRAHVCVSCRKVGRMLL